MANQHQPRIYDPDLDVIGCSTCKQVKCTTEFHKDSSNKYGVSYACKQCANANTRRHHTVNKDSIEYNSKKRSSYFKVKYSISLEERNKILEEQDNSCAICFTPLLSEGTLTHTDHCHTTGKLRGILCTNCNRGLGHFKDNIHNMKNAIAYLEYFK